MKNIQRVEDIREGIAEGDVFIREDFIGGVAIAFVHTVIGGDGQPAKNFGKYHLVESAPSGAVMFSRSYLDALDWICAIEARGPLTSWTSRQSDIVRRDLVGSEHADDARIIQYEDAQGVDYRVEFFPKYKSAGTLEEGDVIRGVGTFGFPAEVLGVYPQGDGDGVRVEVAPIMDDRPDLTWKRMFDWKIVDSIALHTPTE